MTASSLAAVVGCATAHPVGSVAQPEHQVTPVADAAPGPETNTGPTAEPEVVAPSVGTTAHVPDRTPDPTK